MKKSFQRNEEVKKAIHEGNPIACRLSVLFVGNETENQILADSLREQHERTKRLRLRQTVSATDLRE